MSSHPHLYHHHGHDIAAQANKEHFDNPEHAQEKFPHVEDIAARCVYRFLSET